MNMGRSLLDNASNYLVGCVIQKRTTDSNRATCDTNFSLNIFSPFSSHCGAPPPQSAEFAYIRVRAQNKYMVYSATGVALKLWQEDPRALKRGAAPHHYSSIYIAELRDFFLLMSFTKTCTPARPTYCVSSYLL